MKKLSKKPKFRKSDKKSDDLIKVSKKTIEDITNSLDEINEQINLMFARMSKLIVNLIDGGTILPGALFTVESDIPEVSFTLESDIPELRIENHKVIPAVSSGTVIMFVGVEKHSFVNEAKETEIRTEYKWLIEEAIYTIHPKDIIQFIVFQTNGNGNEISK